MEARIVERSQDHRVLRLVEIAFHGVDGERLVGVDFELGGAQHVEPELDVGGATGQDGFEVADRSEIVDDAVDEALVALGFFFGAEVLSDVGSEEAVLDGVAGRRSAAGVGARAGGLLGVLAIGASARIDLRAVIGMKAVSFLRADVGG